MSRSERSNGLCGGLRVRHRPTTDAPGVAVSRFRTVAQCGSSAAGPGTTQPRIDARGRAGIGRRIVKTFELLSIIGSIAAVGLALGAIVIGSNANLHTELRTEMQSLRAELRTEIADVRGGLRSVENRLAAVERRQARTEGLLEGLRDAITAQRIQDHREQKDAT